MELSGENPSLRDFVFNSGISSRSLNKQQGVANIPFTGYYTLRVVLPFVNRGSSVEKATMSVMLNEEAINTYSADLW